MRGIDFLCQSVIIRSPVQKSYGKSQRENMLDKDIFRASKNRKQ